MNLGSSIIGFLELTVSTMLRIVDRRATQCKIGSRRIRRILRVMTSRMIPMRKPMAFIRDLVDSFRSAAKFTLLLKKEDVNNRTMPQTKKW